MAIETKENTATETTLITTTANTTTVDTALAHIPQTVSVPSTEERARKRVAALKYADDGRLATLSELGDERRSLTKNEQIKLEKPGPQVWQDVLECYAKQGFSAIEEGDFERLKWIGWYQQRPRDGYFMMRLKLAGGWVSNEQLRVIASLARDYARNVADISTRQAIQMHWLTIEQAPEIMERLSTVGLGVNHGLFGACGDICRNIVSSPLAGIDPDEVIDTRDFVREANLKFSSQLEYADLPRKFKVGIFGHPSAGQVEINCLSFYGVKRSDGKIGYGIMVGGGLSSEPHLAQDLGVFVHPEQALATMEAIICTYRDHGYRKNRKHARLKYLVADWGAAKLRYQVEEALGYRLVDAEETIPLDTSSSNSVGTRRGYQDKLGVHDQVQEGLQWVGVPVVAGRLTSEQLEAVADIASEFGSGEIRLTVMQNLYIINIPREKIPSALAQLHAVGLPVENTSAVRRGIVACTGIEFCNLAVTETKQRAQNLVTLLDKGVKWNESEFFRINVNGCPNSCGQHWIADVGLQGCTKKIDGELVEHFDVFLGGALGHSQSGGARFNRRIKRVTAEAVAPAIEKAVAYYQEKRQGSESFADFCARHSDEELAEVLQ
jgi:sulfite reductase beta subunit-like hemoprotein